MPGTPPRIAVIAWGSLVPNPGTLRPRTTWATDGPQLPVEFSRISSKSENNKVRVTLALLPGAKLVPTYWAELDCPTPAAAREALADREQTTGSRRLQKIGIWSRDAGTDGRLADVNAAIETWATAKGLDGAVWTDLQPNFPKAHDLQSCYVAYEESLLADLVAHFRKYQSDTNIDGTWFSDARRDVETTPKQINTRCRAALEATFAWTCLSEI